MIAATAHYNDLVKDGGRPLYPISLWDQISRNPEEYHQLLLPWQTHPNNNPPEWDIFREQLARWEDFRRWQYDNRKIDDYDGLSAYIEWEKRDYEREGTSWQKIWRGQTEEIYIKRLEEKWAQRTVYREVHGDYGFPEYVKAVKQRLAQHNFTRPVQLQEDPRQQDKLTTWIEYLNYEYWWFDKYTRRLNRLEAHFDKSWKELVNSGVVMPSEDSEQLRFYDSRLQRWTEQQQQKEAVELAKSAAEAAKTATQNGTSPVRRRMSEEASSGLDKEEEALKAIVRRNDLIDEFLDKTKRCVDCRIKHKCQSNLVRWILDQVSLIDAEVKESQAAEDSLNAGHDSGKKSGRDCDQRDEFVPDRASTERGRSGQTLSSDDEAQSAAQEGRRPKRSHPDETVPGKEKPPKRRRIIAQDLHTQRLAPDGLDAASSRTRRTSKIPTSKRSGSDEIPSESSDTSSVRSSRRIARPRFSSALLKSQSRAAESESQHRQQRVKSIGGNHDEIANKRNSTRKRSALLDSGPNYDVENEPARKRHKADHYSGHSPDETDIPTAGKRKKSTIEARGSSAAPQPLRRSARIAARRDLQQSSAIQSGAAKGLPRGSRTRRAKPIASPPPKKPRNPQSKTSAARTRTQNAKSTNTRGTAKAKETLKGRRRGRQLSAAG